MALRWKYSDESRVSPPPRRTTSPRERMLDCTNYGTSAAHARRDACPLSKHMKCNNILDAVGRTPLVRLNRINQGLKPQIYVKADYINPGGSVKDRIGITMIDDAEKKGLLKPGGTIIEGTSGNTGMGLALVAAVRGYKMVFTITDKQSKEKVDLLKALGAEVIGGSDRVPHRGRAGRSAQLLLRGEKTRARNPQFLLSQSIH